MRFHQPVAAGQALKSLEAAMRLNPAPVLVQDICKKQGYLYFQLGRIPEAQQAFSHAVELAPNDPDIQIAMAEVLIELHDFKKAVSYLEHAQVVRNSKDLRRMLALAYAESDETAKARVQYEQLLAEETRPSPEAEQAGISLAYLEAKLGNLEKSAERVLQAYNDGSKQHTELLIEAAEKFSLAENWPRAAEVYLAYLQSASSSSTSKAKAWEALGHVYTKLGQQQLAAESFQNAVNAGRDGEELLRKLAFTYYALGEWQLSLEKFLAAANKERRSESLMGAARCYEHLNKPGLAILYLNQALEGSASGDSGRLAALEELGYLYYGVQEYGSAAKAWEQSLQIKEDTSICLREFQVRRLLGDIAGAEQIKQGLRPEELSVADRVGYLDDVAALAKQQGDLEGSKRALLQANQLAPAAWRHYQLGSN